MPEEEVARRKREAARAARFREHYRMLGLRAVVDRHGNLEITVGATNAKGVMPCGGSGSPSVAGHNASGPGRLSSPGLVVRATLASDGALLELRVVA